MMLLTAVGAAMVATSVIGMNRNMPSNRLKKTLRRYFDANNLEGVKVSGIYRRENGYLCSIALPMNVTAAEIQHHVPGIEQVTDAHVRFSYRGGPTCTLEFGFADFRPRMALPPRMYVEPLTVPLFTPFGKRLIDFRQETSCHMLIGGATRMGKTVLIRLIATLLITSTKGNVVLKMLDNKVNDLYMFKKIPQVQIGETEDEALTILLDAVQESEVRKALLRRHDACVDIAEYRRKYPDSEPVPPYFIIIDEYGRFADNDAIQKAVERLVETAGYVDMHVIIASQRPDAQTVLKARIKANLTTRICFTTMDEMNSKVVLDIPDAVRLGKIQGRAVLLDGFPEVVQVPQLTTQAALEMLQPYKELIAGVDPARREIDQDVKPFSSFEPTPVGEGRVSEPKKRDTNRKSRAKKAST